MVIVFATGALVVRNILNQPTGVTEVAKQPEVQPPAKPDEVAPVVKEENKPEPVVAGIVDNTPLIVKNNRQPLTEYRKRSMSSIDSSLVRAEVIKGEPVGVSAAFPIDASLQPFKVSLDDGRGNARTISVPTISFGSQRIVQSGNQFAPKRDW